VELYLPPIYDPETRKLMDLVLLKPTESADYNKEKN
jgi:hypothetical protein